MDRVRVETVELDEQLWQKWVQKGNCGNRLESAAGESSAELSGAPYCL
jgi:hypothetical protein